MKIVHLVVFRICRLALITASIFSFLGIVVLLCVLFSIPPYITLGNTTIGFTRYANGFPVKLTIQTRTQAANTMKLVKAPVNSGYFGNFPNVTPVETEKPSPLFNKIQVDEATVYIQPKNMKQLLLLVLPRLLNDMLMAWVFLQLFLLSGKLGEERIFRKANYKKLWQTGLFILGIELVLLFLQFIKIPEISTISVAQPSGGLTLQPESHFSIYWFLSACILLFLSSILTKGYDLQKTIKTAV